MKFASKFDRVYIEISNICNLQCSFCPEVVRSKKLMKPDLFEKIIPQLVPITDQVCFHLMGDPLLHPNLEHFVKVCQATPLKINLVCNGTLLNEAKSTLLLNPAFRQVNFSLHSFFDNFPEKDPTEYLEKIFSFTERAFVERPDLYINYRLWNLDEVTKVASKRNQEMLAKIEECFQFQLERKVDVTQKKSYQVKHRLYLHFDTEFIWPSLDLPIIGEKGTCHGLSSHFGILADGTVVPCCLDKEGKIPLGQVNDTPIVEILNSVDSRAILEGFRNRKLINSLCQRCDYITRF